ncbi:MAG: S8 family serine peptidase [Mangrovibacterium sp.]
MYKSIYNRFLMLCLVGLLTALASCVNEIEIEPIDEPESVSFDGANVVEGQMRVKITNELEAEPDFSAEKLAILLGADSVERTFPYGGKYEKRMRKSGLHLWYEVYINQDKLSTKSVSTSDICGIQLVEPTYKITRVGEPKIVEASSIGGIINSFNSKSSLPFDDPMLYQQWHYQNDGSLGDEFIAGADINLFPAWKLETGNPEVVVAIFDGGVEYTHPDLAANIWVNTEEEQGTDGVDNDDNGYIGDVHGWNFFDNSNVITYSDHATHVAGTVAAVNNNGIGVSGIAGGDGTPNSGARLMICQLASSGGEYGTDVVLKRAFAYAANNGAVIAQCSWGYNYRFELSQSDEDAINYFIDNAGTDENGKVTGPMKGGLAIFAAGNSGVKDPVYPAAMDRVLAVSSMRQDFIIPSSSNYGTYVDVVAPGGDQYDDGRPWIWSTGINGRYISMIGTSMATPHVSGVAALIVSKYGVGHEGLTPEIVTDILKGSAHDEIYDYNPAFNFLGEKRLGAGYIDAYATLMSASDQTATSDLSVKWGATSALVSWTVPQNEYDQTPSGYIVIYSTSPLDQIDPNNILENVNQVYIDGADASAGSELSTEISGLSQATNYYIGIISKYTGDRRSTPTSISGKTTELGIRLYPNPVRNTLNLKTGRDLSLVDLTIYNSAGAEVYSSAISNLSTYDSAKVNVSKLTAGTYQVVLRYNGIKETRNIIKL